MTTPLRYDDFYRALESLARRGPYSPGADQAQLDLMRDKYAAFLQSWKMLNPAMFLIDGLDVYEEAVIDFGRQMAAHSALAMPSQSFFFQWDHEVVIEHADVEGAAPGDRINQTTGMFVLVVGIEHDSLKVLCARGCINNMIIGMSDLFICDLYSDEAVRLLNLPKDNNENYSLGRDEKDIADRTNASFIEEIIAFLSILSIKDVEKRREGPSPRIQKKRTKRGMAPLPEYVRLVISPAVAARMDSSTDRSSPRPHFRRGHLRTVFRGTDKQKLVIVSPTWVKGEATIRPYVVC